MGTSIGVEPKGAGTMGGYVKLRDSGTGATFVYGLTTYHVVRGSNDKWPAHVDNEFCKWPANQGAVQSPSESDHQAEMLQLKQRLWDQEQTFKNSTLRMEVEYGNPSARQRQTYNNFTESIQQYQDRLDECQKLDKNGLFFGQVQFSSGFRKASAHALDWALVKVHHERLGENILPDPSSVIPLKLTQTRVRETEAWDQLSERFFKTGRSTGVTMGHYSHIKSHVELEMPSNSENKRPPPRITSEHVAVLESRSFDKDLSFCDDGDAGAWLMGEGGELMGLILGAGGVGQCYFTPIALVLEDIEKTTGMTVEL